MAKVASEFEKIINADRARKKNEALAVKIFGRDQRRSSAPIRPGALSAAGSLASRAGVKKRVASTSTSRAGNINTEWTHDLHDAGPRPTAGGGGGGSLANRITRPGAKAPMAAPTGPAAGNLNSKQRRAMQLAQAIFRADKQTQSTQLKTQAKAQPQQQQKQQQQRIPQNNRGLSIRGLAAGPPEPFVVMAQNFAPGTTAADIESAVTPVGGLVMGCRVLKTSPIVIAEIVFESREGAERVISTFHNQTADGRLLQVYPRIGASSAVATTVTTTTAPLTGASGNSQRSGNESFMDGSLGFDGPFYADGTSYGRGGEYNNSDGNNARNGGGNGGKLYSDDLVGSRPAVPANNGSRRGGGRGRGGRWGGGRR